MLSKYLIPRSLPSHNSPSPFRRGAVSSSHNHYRAPLGVAALHRRFLYPDTLPSRPSSSRLAQAIFNMKCFKAGSKLVKVASRCHAVTLSRCHAVTLWCHTAVTLSRHTRAGSLQTSAVRACTQLWIWNVLSTRQQQTQGKVTKTKKLKKKRQQAAERMRLYRCIDAVFTRDVYKLETCNYISYFSYHKPLLSITKGSG
jgi:hypothetical protein